MSRIRAKHPPRHTQERMGGGELNLSICGQTLRCTSRRILALPVAIRTRRRAPARSPWPLRSGRRWRRRGRASRNCHRRRRHAAEEPVTGIEHFVRGKVWGRSRLGAGGRARLRAGRRGWLRDHQPGRHYQPQAKGDDADDVFHDSPQKQPFSLTHCIARRPIGRTAGAFCVRAKIARRMTLISSVSKSDRLP